MNRINLIIVILNILFLTTYTKMSAFGFVGQEDRKCKYLRMDKLLKIRCFDMNLKEVPQYLSSSVEVLDLSFNRIKKLKITSFLQYKKLKYLLLYENMIQSVEPGTFAHLTSLQEIDLSNNALMTIPMDIFQLPSLRNLYVDSNDLINLSRDLQMLQTPITAPLEYLNVADCGLSDIPNLGIVPNMWHINVSANPLTEITIENFATMCHLKSVDLTKTQMPNCACQQVNGLLRYLNVKTKFVPICPAVIEISECPLAFNLTIETEVFHQCRNAITHAEAKSIWILVASCIASILMFLFVALYCVHRRNVRRTEKKAKKRFVILSKNAANQQNEEVLRLDTS